MANVRTRFRWAQKICVAFLAVGFVGLAASVSSAIADGTNTAPFCTAPNVSLIKLDQRQGDACPSSKPLNYTMIGGNDDRDSDGKEKIVSCTVNHYTKYPPQETCTFNCASNSKGMYMNLLNQLSRSGEIPSDSKTAAIGAYCAQMTADILQHPSNAADQSRAQTLGNIQQAGDSFGGASQAQAASAIDYCTRFMQNFTTDGSNRWNQIRLNLFVPIAILLVLPGAVLTQAKVLKDATEPMLDNAFPFEGLTRAAIAIFAIGASALVPNYSIDFANAVSAGIANGYQQIVGSNMYEDAIGFQVRGTPVRTPSENQNAGNAQIWSQPTIKDFKTYEDAMFRTNQIDGPGQDQADPSRTNEGMPASSAMARFAAFGLNSGLTMTWNILCAFQQAYLAYLFLVGPIACAMWVWPIDGFRQALPSWIEGCITVCFWSLFWNTCILLMACFKGVDTTNTMVMTALNFLTTASVKFAFDFASLVKNAGEQAGQQATQGAQGGQAGGGAGGGKSAGKSAGAGKSQPHMPKNPGRSHEIAAKTGGPVKTAVNSAVVPTAFHSKTNNGNEGAVRPANFCAPPTGGLPKLTPISFGGRTRSVEHSNALSDKTHSIPMHPVNSEASPASVATANSMTHNNAFALKTADGNTLFFSPGANGAGNEAQVLSPTSDGGFSSTPVMANGGGDDDDGDPNVSASQDEEGTGWYVAYTNQEGDVDNYHITPAADGNGYDIAHDVNGEDAGNSSVAYADGQTMVAEYAPGQANPSAIHSYGADGSSTSTYYSNGSTTPDMRAVTHPYNHGDQTGYQTTYYHGNSTTPTGSMTHLDNKHGGWSEAAFGANGQPLSTTSQTMNGDGTYTIASQDFRRDGSIGSSEKALYSLEGHHLQSLARESTSPDGMTTQSLAQFNANQELVNASAITSRNGVPVSSMDFARDSNGNVAERQTNYDQFGAVSSTISAAFDSNGSLVGGQMSYADGPLSDVTLARTSDGDYFARQSYSDGSQSDSIVSYDSASNSWNNVQAAGFDASPPGPDINHIAYHDNSLDQFHTTTNAGDVTNITPANFTEDRYAAQGTGDVTNISTYTHQSPDPTTTTSSTFDSSSSYSVSAQDAYNAQVNQHAHEHQQQHHVAANNQWANVPSQTIDGGTSYQSYAKDVVMPPQEHPNSDAIVQKTLASLEQLAVHWMATRMEALKAIEDKPLAVNPAKGLDGVSNMGVVNPPPMPNHIVTNWNDGGYYAAQSNAGANASNIDKMTAQEAAVAAGSPTAYDQTGMESNVQDVAYSGPPLESGQNVARAEFDQPTTGQKSTDFSRDAVTDGAVSNHFDNSMTVHDNSLDNFNAHHTAVNPPAETPHVHHANVAESTFASPSIADAAAVIAYNEQKQPSDTLTTQSDASFTSANTYDVSAKDAYGAAALHNHATEQNIVAGQAHPNPAQPISVPDQTIDASSSTVTKDITMPPQNVNMPNADALVQKTVASLEQLAVHWMATRMEAMKAIEDKPLDATPAKGLDGVSNMGVVNPPPMPNHIVTNWTDGGYYAAQSNAGANANAEKMTAEQAALIAGNPTDYGKDASANARFEAPPLQTSEGKLSAFDQAVAAGRTSNELSRDAVQLGDVANHIDNSTTVHDNSTDPRIAHHLNSINSISDTGAKPGNAANAGDDTMAMVAYRDGQAKEPRSAQPKAQQQQSEAPQMKVPDQTIETTNVVSAKDSSAPPVGNLPSADAIVQKTMASLENLAVGWVANKVQALNAINDKGLDPAQPVNPNAPTPPSTTDRSMDNLNAGYYPASNLSRASNADVPAPPLNADGKVDKAGAASSDGPTLNRIDQTINNVGMTSDRSGNPTPGQDPAGAAPTAPRGPQQPQNKPAGEEKGAFFGKILDVSNRPTKPAVGPPPSHDKANIKKVLDQLQTNSEKKDDEDKSELPSWMKW